MNISSQPFNDPKLSGGPGLAPEVHDALAEEERDGHNLSVRARLYALLAIAILLLFVNEFPAVFYFIFLIGVFAAIGLLAVYCQDKPWFKTWHQYLFVFADFALLTFTILYPNPFSQIDYPPQIILHGSNVVYLYIILVGLAFRYRPRLVIWGGLAGAICWFAGLAAMLALPDTLTQWNVDPGLMSSDPVSFIVQPTFIDLGMRLQEVVVFVVCAGLIAAVVFRSRKLVLRQVNAERERHFVREALGKYVPESVANAIVADHGALQPQRQTATILFADIEGFTALVERIDPADVFAVLNEYFAAIGGAIVDEGGVINQFQGDAVLATFNLPVRDPEHAAAAVRAARRIQEICQNRIFANQRVRARIGIATGEVIAGSVGSGEQLAYTVHGDAVNLAARLEQMNKETGTDILIAEETIEAAGSPPDARAMGEIPIRGRTPANIFSI